MNYHGSEIIAPRHLKKVRGFKPLEEKEVCAKLVGIFGTLMDRPDLVLKMDASVRVAHTDGTVIAVPLDHPHRREVTKHELAHVVFNSDVELRLKFVHQLLSEMGVDPNGPNHLSLTHALCFFINILDDVRVNSLWGLAYPGDKRKMDRWYFEDVGPRMLAREVEKNSGTDIPELFPFAILLWLKQDVQSSRWGRFKDRILQAVEDVHYKTFEACLLVTKKLIKDITEELVREMKDAGQAPSQPLWGGIGDLSKNAALDQKIKALAEELQGDDEGKKSFQKAALKKMMGEGAGLPEEDANAGFDVGRSIANPSSGGRTGARRAIQRLTLSKVNRVDTQDSGQMQTALAEMEAGGFAIVEKIRERERRDAKATTGRANNPDDLVTTGVRCRVDISRPRRGEMIPAALSPEQRFEAQKWRRHFSRLIGRQEEEPQEEGEVLIAELYLQQRLNREPLQCFTAETRSRGFDVTMLLDMSGSMAGQRYERAEQLALMLDIALDFPFVRTRVLGFSQIVQSATSIVEFPRKSPGLTTQHLRPNGYTPLPFAVLLAGNHMRAASLNNRKLLFVLSDGMPTFQWSYESGRDFASADSLIEETGKAVLANRKKGVETHCFMIREGAKDRTDDMNRMFGSNWRHIRSSNMLEDSFDFLRRKFFQFLQRR